MFVLLFFSMPLVLTTHLMQLYLPVKTLYQNQTYRAPNESRKAQKAAYGTKYANRRKAKDTTRRRKENAKLPATVFDDVFS